MSIKYLIDSSYENSHSSQKFAMSQSSLLTVKSVAFTIYMRTLQKMHSHMQFNLCINFNSYKTDYCILFYIFLNTGKISEQ